MLPHLAEALGVSCEVMTELEGACKRLREARELLQKANEEHDKATELVRSVRAKLSRA
jgi:hypothetical protein